MMITRKTAEQLIQSGIFHINLSLESIIPEENDDIRGIPGHFNRVMRSIDLLDEFKKVHSSTCNLGIHTTLSAMNMPGITRLVQWVDANEKLYAIRFQAVTQVFGTPYEKRWYTRKEFAPLWPKDRSQVVRVYDKLADMKRNGSKIDNSFEAIDAQKKYLLNPQIRFRPESFRCNVYQGAMIHADGRINMCPVKNMNLGNANDPKFGSAGIGKNILLEQNKIRNCKMYNCHFVINCKFN